VNVPMLHSLPASEQGGLWRRTVEELADHNRA
jgi:hypothetical protein